MARLLDDIPMESPLVDETLRAELSKILSKLQEKVTLKAVVDLEQEKDRELGAFLKAVVSLSKSLELELYTPKESDLVPELNIKYLPVTGLYQQDIFKRVSFHGIPAGKEINSFILAIYNLAGPGQEIGQGLVKKIQKLNKKNNIKVCVSLACHHCPGVVAACQRIAILNENIEAEMIDAALYENLVKEYKIERVPFIIINDQESHMGAKAIEDIVTLLKK